jgi:hypothetical protein
MEPVELFEALLELADEVELEVRILRGQNPADTDFTPDSSCCRVKGKVWVVLSPNDPVDLHIRVLASALKSEAGSTLEARYLPPAIRAALDTEIESV